MFIQIDTSKIPNNDILFIAELVLLSGKNNCTVDESVKNCKEILKKKENK
jgi:hypothetical protein